MVVNLPQNLFRTIRDSIARKICDFLSSESGAVTVDWVVLSAALVGMGVVSVTAVQTGTTTLGAQIENTLNNARIAALEFPYLMQGLSPELAQNRANHYARASTEQIIAFHQSRANYLMGAIAQGHFTPTGDVSNLSAGETLDVLYLHRQELVARGAYPVDGVPSFNELKKIYMDARY